MRKIARKNLAACESGRCDFAHAVGLSGSTSSFPEARVDLGQIAAPQALDMFDEKLAGPVSKHHREKEYPTFDFWAPISRYRRIIA